MIEEVANSNIPEIVVSTNTAFDEEIKKTVKILEKLKKK